MFLLTENIQLHFHFSYRTILNVHGEYLKRIINYKDQSFRTSLAVQWLRLHLPMQGVRVRSLVGELRSHMSRGQKIKT